MTRTEWEAIAARISALWAPRMQVNEVAAYLDVLKGLPVADVRRAVDLIARTDRDRRPSAGLILATATGHGELPPNALPAPREADLLTAREHRQVMAELTSIQIPEHNRRYLAIMSLLPRRLPVSELTHLLSISRCEPEEFDHRLAVLTRDMDRT
jgi:hypothetical protein